MINKNWKKMLGMVATLGVVTTGLAACGNSEDKESSEGASGKTKITFWAAPNPTQYKYWQDMAKEFEKENENITVEVSQMKESPSSEATIQSAVASNTTPTISENITRSFAAQLADSKAIIPVNDLEHYDDIISERSMDESIKGWAFGDGSNYVLPVYSNPILLGWRKDILAEAGVDNVPTTYTETLDAAKKLKEKYPDKLLWGKSDGDLTDTTAWLRWFDFFPLYDAASDGNAYVTDGEFVADEAAFTNVLTFASDLAEEKMVQIGAATDPFENGDAVMTVLGPWNFANWAEKYPELNYQENFDVTAPMVPGDRSDVEMPKTYADAKGIVVYADATEEEQKAAMAFLNFVYSDPQHDVELMEKTNLIPARDDAVENEAFKAYFDENPEMSVYADYVSNAVPSMDDARFNDIQTILGEQAWVPTLRQEVKADQAWSDNKKAVEEVLK